MKPLVLVLLLITSQSIFAQNNYDNLVSTTDEKKADALLEKVRLKQATEDEKNELQRIAVLIQNKAQNQDPNQRDYKKSLASIDKAIVLFDALNDTLDVANNKKFKGFLLGRLGKFRDAKNETTAAIQLYQIKKMNAEVAVSQFDLARMFEFEGKPDSAIYYAGFAHTFWKQKDVDLRVLIINNMLVSLYLKSQEPEQAKTVQQESALLLSKPDMHWQAVIDFYYTSMLLFRTVNDIGVAGDYRKLYDAKIEELRRTGIIAKSYYENDR